MMRLSEAIRLGAMMKPQAFDGLSDDQSCALQAACDAIGMGSKHWAYILKAYPWLIEPALCPVKGRANCDNTENFAHVIYHLNDTHRWTRERIADWVSEIEQQQEPAAKEPVHEDA